MARKWKIGEQPKNAREEKQLDAYIEKSFRSQRELPNGRDFRFDCRRHDTDESRSSYSSNFSGIKWNSSQIDY